MENLSRINIFNFFQKSSYVNWFKKGSFALADQFIFSGTNFLINILLARWLATNEYGAFSVAFSAFLFFATIHTALLTEPMLVFGAGKYKGDFRKYTGFLISIHFWISGLISFLLIVVTVIMWMIGNKDLAKSFGGLAIASPFILLMWLTRRAFYVKTLPQIAAIGGILYSLIMFAIVLLIFKLAILSSFFSFLSMGFAGLAVSLWFIKILRPEFHISRNLFQSDVIKNHREYGRWSIATAIFSWFPLNIYFAILPFWMSLDEIGSLRALINFSLPMTMVFAALSMLILPKMSRKFNIEGVRGLKKIMNQLLILFSILSFFYFMVLAIIGKDLFHLVYRGKFSAYSSLVILVGIFPIGSAFMNVINSAFKSREMPKTAFWAYLGLVFGTFALGIPLAYLNGIRGSLIGMILSSIPALFIQLMFLVKMEKRD